VEDEVAIENTPAPAREAILKAAGTGKIKRVEQVRENNITRYEAAIKKDGESREFKVDANGISVN
jgi:uncharacterized membrane protein YkoI